LGQTALGPELLLALPLMMRRMIVTCETGSRSGINIVRRISTITTGRLGSGIVRSNFGLIIMHKLVDARKFRRILLPRNSNYHEGPSNSTSRFPYRIGVVGPESLLGLCP
jgi:hypothetical protein